MSRADRACSELRQLITEGGVRPNDRLAETQVASWLGISRTPVRQALQRLEQEGLVQKAPGGGYLVAELSSREARETVDLLEVLDVAIFSGAAARMSPEGADELVRSADVLKSMARRGDVQAWEVEDRRFHSLVELAADNSLMADVARQMRRRLHRFWVATAVRQGRLETCSHEHRQIAEAVRSGDEAAIATHVRAHHAHVRMMVRTMLDSAAPFLRREREVPFLNLTRAEGPTLY